MYNEISNFITFITCLESLRIFIIKISIISTKEYAKYITIFVFRSIIQYNTYSLQFKLTLISDLYKQIVLSYLIYDIFRINVFN